MYKQLNIDYTLVYLLWFYGKTRLHIIIQHINGKQYIGLVNKITKDKYNSKTVFILWSEDAPNVYNVEYGYSLTNIHNCRNEFDIIK